MKQSSILRTAMVFIATLTAFFLAQSHAADPLKVENVTFAQQQPGPADQVKVKKVDIQYSVTGGIPPYQIKVWVLKPGATGYEELPLSDLKGDLGTVETEGDKKVTWDAEKKWDRNYSDQIKFKVKADDSADSLVAYYPFEGNTNDASGNGHDGIQHGGLTYVTGVSGSAIQLDGSTGYVKVSAKAADFNFADALTLAVWVYPNNGQQEYAVILDKSHSSPSNYTSWVLQQKGSSLGNFYFGYGYGSAWTNSSNPVLGSPSLPISAWSHLAVTKSGTSIKYFLNGSYAGGQTTANPSITPNGDLSLFIGRFWWDSEPRFFSGKLDEIRIYNRALSAAEIQQLYNSNH